jgi:hypothetical protein
MYSPPRLVLAFEVCGRKGAVACNYIGALDFSLGGDRVRREAGPPGRQRDRDTANRVERGRRAEYLSSAMRFGMATRHIPMICFIVRRKPCSEGACDQGRARRTAGWTGAACSSSRGGFHAHRRVLCCFRTIRRAVVEERSLAWIRETTTAARRRAHARMLSTRWSCRRWQRRTLSQPEESLHRSPRSSWRLGPVTDRIRYTTARGYAAALDAA